MTRNRAKTINTFPVRRARPVEKAAVIASCSSDRKTRPTPLRGRSRTPITRAKSNTGLDKLDYKCFCVKPILEGELTVDGVKYTVRFQLCGQGSCDLTNIPVFEETGKHQEIKCTGKCEGECKCTLFRLQVAGKAGFDPKDAKWELIAKADKQVRHDGNYVYRCFCLK